MLSFGICVLCFTYCQRGHVQEGQMNRSFQETLSGTMAELPVHCRGWPAHVALNARLLEQRSTQGWIALADGDPALALRSFETSSDDEEGRRVGMLRAWAELARALWRAQEVSLDLQRSRLERLLSEGAANSSGLELVAFLRAAVALEAGERVPLEAWLSQVPDQSHLRRAREVLRKARRAAGGPTEMPAEKATLSQEHYEEYAKALGTMPRECPAPYPGSAAHRSERLSSWLSRSDHIPPLHEWRARLELDNPDFHIGTCDGSQSGFPARLYDPSLYGVLARVALMQVRTLAGTGSVDRFLWIWALEPQMPGQAQKEACTLAREWSGMVEDDVRSLIFGDWSDEADLRMTLEQLCGASHEVTATPERSSVQGMWDQRLRRDAMCYQELRQRNPDGGDVAERLLVYSGMSRRRLLEPVLSGLGGSNVAKQYFELWSGEASQPSRWRNLESLLALIHEDTRKGNFARSARELVKFTQEQPEIAGLLEPVSDMISRATFSGGSTGGIERPLP